MAGYGTGLYGRGVYNETAPRVELAARARVATGTKATAYRVRPFTARAKTATGARASLNAIWSPASVSRVAVKGFAYQNRTYGSTFAQARAATGARAVMFRLVEFDAKPAIATGTRATAFVVRSRASTVAEATDAYAAMARVTTFDVKPMRVAFGARVSLFSFVFAASYSRIAVGTKARPYRVQPYAARARIPTATEAAAFVVRHRSSVSRVAVNIHVTARYIWEPLPHVKTGWTHAIDPKNPWTKSPAPGGEWS